MPSRNTILTVLMLAAAAVPAIYAAPYDDHVGAHRLSPNDRREMSDSNNVYAREDLMQQRRAETSSATTGAGDAASAPALGSDPSKGEGPNSPGTNTLRAGIMAAPGLGHNLVHGPVRPLTAEEKEEYARRTAKQSAERHAAFVQTYLHGKFSGTGMASGSDQDGNAGPSAGGISGGPVGSAAHGNGAGRTPEDITSGMNNLDINN